MGSIVRDFATRGAGAGIPPNGQVLRRAILRAGPIDRLPEL